MTGTDFDSDRDGKAEIADAFVLGLLDADEQRRVEAEIEHDGDLSRAVASARARFHELDLTARPVDPPADLWTRIEAALDSAPETVDPEKGDIPPPAASRASDRMQANDNRVRGWRVAAFIGMAATVLLSIGLIFNLGMTREPEVVAVLVDEAGAALAIVEDFGDSTARVTPLVNFDVPASNTMQVWTLPNEELGPVSLGLLEGSARTTLHGPDLPEPRAEQLYEITLEQEGGSPTGRPTGPILAKGFAAIAR